MHINVLNVFPSVNLFVVRGNYGNLNSFRGKRGGEIVGTNGTTFGRSIKMLMQK